MSRSLYRLGRFTARRSWVVIRTSDSGGHAPEAISRMGMAPAGNSISMSSFSIVKLCRMGPGIHKRRSRAALANVEEAGWAITPRSVSGKVDGLPVGKTKTIEFRYAVRPQS